MTKLKKPGAKGDGPPIFSHEFVIKNHGDILSCICVVVFVMLMFQVFWHQHVVILNKAHRTCLSQPAP